MSEASHITDVVLDVSGVSGGPPGVDGGGQVMRSVPPERLLASRKARHRVVGARGGGVIMGVPQQVDVKGVL